MSQGKSKYEVLSLYVQYAFNRWNVHRKLISFVIEQLKASTMISQAFYNLTLESKNQIFIQAIQEREKKLKEKLSTTDRTESTLAFLNSQKLYYSKNPVENEISNKELISVETKNIDQLSEENINAELKNDLTSIVTSFNKIEACTTSYGNKNNLKKIDEMYQKGITKSITKIDKIKEKMSKNLNAREEKKIKKECESQRKKEFEVSFEIIKTVLDLFNKYEVKDYGSLIDKINEKKEDIAKECEGLNDILLTFCYLTTLGFLEDSGSHRSLIGCVAPHFLDVFVKDNTQGKELSQYEKEIMGHVKRGRKFNLLQVYTRLVSEYFGIIGKVDGILTKVKSGQKKGYGKDAFELSVDQIIWLLNTLLKVIQDLISIYKNDTSAGVADVVIHSKKVLRYLKKEKQALKLVEINDSELMGNDIDQQIKQVKRRVKKQEKQQKINEEKSEEAIKFLDGIVTEFETIVKLLTKISPLSQPQPENKQPHSAGGSRRRMINSSRKNDKITQRKSYSPSKATRLRDSLKLLLLVGDKSPKPENLKCSSKLVSPKSSSEKSSGGIKTFKNHRLPILKLEIPENNSIKKGHNSPGAYS